MAQADTQGSEIAELYRQTGIDLSILPPVSTAQELAPVIRTTPGSLAQDRYRGGGIPYVVVGRRRVRYLRADVCRYLIEHRTGGDSGA